MSSAAEKLLIPFAEYVAAERKSDRKHELIDGEVFAMTGGSFAHSKLIVAVGAELRLLLRGRPCVVYGSETRVRIEGLATYPDCVVGCGQPHVDPEDADTLLDPTLLVEVLSETAEGYDRGKKSERYRRIASLREYLFVSQTDRHIELFRRGERGWTLLEFGAGEGVPLESIGCQLEVDAVYEGILGQAG